MDLENDEVIYEVASLGPLLRCAALHVPTLTEVVVQGPTRAGPAALQRVALRKLAHVLSRRTDRADRSSLSPR